jgi:DNA-directed RNA polymerase specialized sigma24 family protein
MPYDGIAVRLGINLGTVRSRLARAREALLAGMGGGAGAP